MADGYIQVATMSDIAEGDSLPISVAGENILICHTNKGVFAVENQCSHQTAALAEGKIRSCFIFCPLHGQRFDLRDGKPIGKLTDKPIKTYALKTQGDQIWLHPHLPAAAQD